MDFFGWEDLDGDGHVDEVESLLADDLMCTNDEEREMNAGIGGLGPTSGSFGLESGLDGDVDEEFHDGLEIDLLNADIDPDEEMYDDDTDFRQVMEQLVSRRRKLCPIKLEYTRLMDESVLDTLCAYLDLKKKHIFHSEAPLDLSFFSRIRDLMRSKKELFYDKYTPQIPADIDMSESIMKQVEQKDRFLFFPYDSMHHSFIC